MPEPILHLLATPDSIASVEALAEFFDGLAQRGPGHANERKIADAVRQGIATNFTGQRAGDTGAWPPLAPRTVQQRKALGFAGSRPILVRTGGYRATLTSAGDPAHVAQFAISAHLGWFLRIGSSDRRAKWHEGGTPKMPARPALLLGQTAEKRIGDTLDYVLQQLEPK